MSLSRNFMREMRPIFRMLEEPFGFHPGFQSAPMRAFLNEGLWERARVPVDVTEQGDSYIVEAEIPGVKKEDIDVRIGDNGRTVTIEGQVVRRSAPAQAAPTESTDNATTAAPAEGKSQPPLSGTEYDVDTGTGATESAQTQAVTQTTPSSNQLSVERTFSSESRFSRHITLPRPVDASRVQAKLVDGILTLTILKAEEPGAVKINIE